MLIIEKVWKRNNKKVITIPKRSEFKVGEYVIAQKYIHRSNIHREFGEWIVGRIWGTKTKNSKFLTIPAKCGIVEGDFVMVDFIRNEDFKHY